jgi:Do/DeqQ family serine protease
MKIFESKNEIVKTFAIVAVSVLLSVAVTAFMLVPAVETHAKQFSESINKNNLLSLPRPQLFGSDVIADIAQEAASSVVHINTETVQTIDNSELQSFFNNDEFFKQFFGFSPFGEGIQQQPIRRKSEGMGSGFIISSDGYILTNNHVVQNASKIMVKMKDERIFPAKLIGKDKYSDLAVIKIDVKGLKPLVLGDSSTIRPGQWAIAIGSPQGLDHTVTLGIVSALSRQIPELSNVSFIQTDAAINPGNSGGPLLNIKGEVVGINAAILGTAQNIGFAIPVNTAKTIVEQLKSGQAIGHPWLGIAMTPVTKEVASALGISPLTKGILIGKVMPDSPAEKAELVAGDIIQKIDGKKFVDPKALQDYIKTKKIGETLTLQILRDGEFFAKKVKVGNWQEN